ALPLGSTPEMTWADVWQYLGDCVDLLMAASTDERPEVARRAAKRLPRILSQFIAQGHHVRGLPHLRAIVDRVLSGDDIFNVTELADSMTWCRRALRGETNEGGDDTNASVIAALTELIARLQRADFPTRMRLWVGGWSLDLDNTAAPSATSEQAIHSLAQEACNQPALLTTHLVNWLSIEAAQAGRFLHYLGSLDESGHFRQLIRQLGMRDNGAQGFMLYIAGWCVRDQQSARGFFHEAASDDRTSPKAILFGALEIDEPDTGAERITRLLAGNRIDNEQIEQVLAGRWIQRVSDSALVPLLELMAGSDMEAAPQIPHLLFFRLHERELTSGPLADFAWRYLEAHPVMNRHLGNYYSDELAARLVPLDTERGFALLDRLVRDDRSGERWNPLASCPQLEFWNALTRVDRGRVLLTLLEAARVGGDMRWTVQWHLPNLVDLVRDAALLGDYAIRGEEEAFTVCEAITGGRPGFWPIAFRLVDL